MNRVLVGVAVVAMIGWRAEAQMAVPSVKAVRPMGVGAGQAATLEVKGENLDGATGVVFEDAGVKVDGIKAAKDRVEVRVRMPKDVPPGVRTFRVVTPRGVSNPGQVVVGRPIATIGA